MTLTKTHAKFQNDQAKIAGVALTRVDTDRQMHIVITKAISLQTLTGKRPIITQHVSCMHGSRNFRQGGRVQVSLSLTKKSSEVVFFCCFFSPQLFYRSQMVKFEEIYLFSRFQRGSNIFQGGSIFFKGEVQLLISYRNPYNL